ncbi:MAG: SufD family Fe-S cluster assembly protein [Candidatus Roizmanbacteria bacterium]|nr:SufD family Fe-S cluster assembly protein [Candidatus Roizmanbacteria bacterium]
MTLTSKKHETAGVLLNLVSDSAERDMEIHMKPAEDSRLFVVILAQLHGNSTYTIRSFQHHSSKQSTSDLLCKSLVRDTSFFRFEGTITIDKTGAHSHAYQKNDNLILSSEGRVVSEPKLEIEAHEVFCTHGSTTGYLSEDEQYYLSTRGVSQQQVEKLITMGFLRSGIQKLLEAGITLAEVESLYGRAGLV